VSLNDDGGTLARLQPGCVAPRLRGFSSGEFVRCRREALRDRGFTEEVTSAAAVSAYQGHLDSSRAPEEVRA
jgi:hypothetical protein